MTKEEMYFKSFCRLSQAFGTAASESELLDLIVQSAIDTMNGKAACLYLADEKKDAFYPVAQKGLSENYLHANPMKAKRIVDSILSGGHLAFTDATTDPRLENLEAKKAEGIASILTVPVRAKNRTIGILSLYTADRREFSKQEVDFLKAMAEQGGVMLSKTRLIDRIKKNARLYLDLSSQINSTLDIKEILDNMTAGISSALGMKGAVIRLVDENTETERTIASYGMSEEFLSDTLGTAVGASAHALKGETLVIHDATTDKRIGKKDKMIKEGVGSMIVAPIQAKDRTIGTLRLYSAQKRDFSEDLLIMVQALAHQGGLAIQNASMYMQLQQDKKDLESEIWTHKSWF
ncbi:MAG: GAF domain-containing protein [Desulfobacterales bacterium]